MPGPNGAGKTTLINILCGLLSPSSGNVFIADYDIRKNIHQIKKLIGVIPQDLAIYEDLTAYDNVKIIAQGSNEEFKSLIKDKSRFIISMKSDYFVDTKILANIQGVLNVETLGPLSMLHYSPTS